MAQERIESALAASAQGEALPFVLTLRESQTLIGWAALHRNTDDPQLGALSYWLGTPHQGHGYASEAVRALIQAGFVRLRLEVIEAGAQVENAASFAVMRACGMAEAGERMVHAPSRGRDEPCRFYSISRTAAWPR